MINTNRGLNLFGPVGVLQGVLGVVVRLGRGANVGNHDRPAVSSQRVFKQSSQLAVSVRYVSLLTLKQTRKVRF